ncbi:hypothetical protein LY90DRAFT_702812 [Neocallimastix californiae]|uniref:Uncharacterized protein n=1 Tax=Neocallimastix californiae TaxID=1754190 RepID=A0A1Y2CVP4_9FUNG|nr:hypothetical protein LY90DRAFT_702812 [Neocallimastix californiae]|eukprot:ORY51139.1 hypothetical protein LY90DRAFT_702812 [Neocallimastix californiae]
MLYTGKIWLIVILFFNFSYGSLNIKPNYGKYKIGEKISISWNLSEKVNNATLSYYSINKFNNFNILSNIFEDNTNVIWEIPEELENDIGYFIIWNGENSLIERSNNILIINTNQINKRAEEETLNKSETVEISSNDNKSTDSSSGTKKSNTSASSSSNSGSSSSESSSSGSSSSGSSSSGSSSSGSSNSNDDNTASSSTKTNSSSSSLNVESSAPLTPISSTINEEAEDTNASNGSVFDGFMGKYKEYIYYIVGGAALAILLAIIIAVKLFGKKNEIPNGKRSIKRFTIHEETVPPINMYNETWKNTLSKNKSYNTLSKNSTKKSLDDSETEQLINNGDELINDAEKFAKKHGLTDKEWVARKDYIPYREDELEVYEDHYSTLSNDNEGMFPSSILPIEVITALLNATGKGTSTNNSNPESSTTSPEEGNNNPKYEVTIDVNNQYNNNNNNTNFNTNTNVSDKTNSNVVTSSASKGGITVTTHNGSQFVLPKPLAVPLMPPKPLPVIPNLNRSSSLRSSVHRKRNSNIIDPSKSPLIMNNFIQNSKRGSQLSTLSNEIDINNNEIPTVVSKQKQKKLFTNSNNKKENVNEDAKALLNESTISINTPIINNNSNASSSNINSSNSNNNININNKDLKQKQQIVSNNDNKDKAKDEIYQQQLLIQKQREQLQQQQLEQQKLQELLKQQQLQQQLQQQQIQKQLQQLQQIQQEKERQILKQKQQLQQQMQKQQIEQQQLRIQQIEYERERLLQSSMMKQDDRDNTLPSYSEAVNNNYASSSSKSNMVEGFPLPPQLNNNYISSSNNAITSPVLNNKNEDENPELYPRNTSYKHQIQKRDNAPEVYPRNISKAYVDEHPSISRK